MSKSDISFFVVMVVAVIAGFVVHYQRRKRAPTLVASPPSPTSSDEPSESPVAAVLPTRVLTARERRRDEILAVAQTERCLYCTADAEQPMPYMAFQQPFLDAAALLSGDLPRHWIVRAPGERSAAPLLCRAHATIARSSIELQAAELHAAYVRFVAAQKEAAHEFTAHGLDEAMRAEAERVRKGSPKGGS